MIHEKTVQKYPLFLLSSGPYQVFYNSKFDFTAKSSVTNTIFITTYLCTKIYGGLVPSSLPKKHASWSGNMSAPINNAGVMPWDYICNPETMARGKLCRF